jgi:hypothetical protein
MLLGNGIPMKMLRFFLALLIGMMPLALGAQTPDAAPEANTRQARTVLDAMGKALGGEAWLSMKNQMRQGHIAAFYQGQPNLGTTLYWEFHQWPDHDRIELTKHRDVLQMYVGRTGWEVTYRGKKELPQEIVDDYLRRRDHSIETVVKVWLKDPRTILLYEGKHIVERRLCEQVTLISPENESVTILVDAESHLPRRRVFEWRNATYKDHDSDAEEYDDYHVIDGFPTAMRITRFHNDELTRQYYIDRVEYNQTLAADFWDVDAAAGRIKKAGNRE